MSRRQAWFTAGIDNVSGLVLDGESGQRDGPNEYFPALGGGHEFVRNYFGFSAVGSPEEQ